MQWLQVFARRTEIDASLLKNTIRVANPALSGSANAAKVV
jgi:hypothetical protein